MTTLELMLIDTDRKTEIRGVIIRDGEVVEAVAAMTKTAVKSLLTRLGHQWDNVDDRTVDDLVFFPNILV